jgi:hypothetical protein
MTANTLFYTLPVLLFSVYGVYLLYVRFRPGKYDSIMKIYKKNSPPYQMRQKIYSTQFLIAWLIMTVWMIVGIGYDYYRVANVPSRSLSMLMFIGTIAVLAVTALLAVRIFRKK